MEYQPIQVKNVSLSEVKQNGGIVLRAPSSVFSGTNFYFYTTHANLVQYYFIRFTRVSTIQAFYVNQ